MSTTTLDPRSASGILERLRVMPADKRRGWDVQDEHTRLLRTPTCPASVYIPPTGDEYGGAWRPCGLQRPCPDHPNYVTEAEQDRLRLAAGHAFDADGVRCGTCGVGEWAHDEQ